MKNKYTIQPIDPKGHLFLISCTVQNPNGAGQKFFLPAWTPGSYKIRDFAKQVSNVRAENQGRTIECHKIDKHTWQCEAVTGAVTLSYTVYAWDLSVRGAHLDQTHATINGASIFMCPLGKEHEACSIEIKRPEGNDYQTWRVATALKRGTAKVHGFGEYHADDYAELIDSPIELGDFFITHFTEQNIPHEVVFTGLAPNTDVERITDDVQQICRYYLKFFPKPYPMSHYVFIINLLEQGFGGLEHRASCLLHFSKYFLPTPEETSVTDSYLSFLTLCSHEYLHTWLVKGIKPSAFMPYDLTHENYTEQLWIFEGFTAYYEDLILVRNGLITDKQFFNLLAQKITRLWRTPGHSMQSVTEASFDAWIKFYQPDEQTPNITISYYLKGSLIALILDIKLRELSENKFSLDTILLEMWKRYHNDSKGVPEKAVIHIIQEHFGPKLDFLIKQTLYSTDALPLAETLILVGITLQKRSARNINDKGEVAFETIDIPANIPVDLGIIYDVKQPNIVILNCLTQSSAHQAGLSAGDVIIAIDNLRVDTYNLNLHLSRYTPGDTITVHAFRRDQLMIFELMLTPALPVAGLVIHDDIPVDAALRRKDWLKSN